MDSQIRGNVGWIEVICGSMFSGKSEELIRRLRRAQIARQRVQIFKPKIDARYSNDHIVSHSDQKMPSQVVSSAAEILERTDLRTEVVGIDEAQFFDKEIVTVCNRLADMGKRVIAAGLDRSQHAPIIPDVRKVDPLHIGEAHVIGMGGCSAPRKRRRGLGRRLPQSPGLLLGGAGDGKGQHDARECCWKKCG